MHLKVDQVLDFFPSASWCFWAVRSNRAGTLFSFARYRSSFGLSDVSPSKSRTWSTFKTEVETTKGAVVNMESTYYNLLAPASYGGLSKFKPKGYTEKEVREWLQSQDTYTLHKP
jgi:hypothetical protein